MKISKSFKAVFMKVFSVAVMLVMLFSTSSLVTVLTQQKALQAAQMARTSQPTDSLIDEDLLEPEIFKTDRFIVKYKENKAQSFKSKLSGVLLESRSLDSVFTSLESSSVLPSRSASGSSSDSRSSVSSRYPDMEVLVLSEKMIPEEFEASLVKSGAYNDILYVQPDYELEIASLGFDGTVSGLLNVNQASPSNSSAPAIIIAVIDTGVDSLHTAYASYLHPSTPDVYDSANPLAFAHGTHIAGIIAGEASLYNANIQILVLPVFSEGYAYTSDILAAIEAAELAGASVVNCSFGNTSFNQALYEAMEESSMLFVCAAGNSRTDLALTQVYPACFGLGNIISVGSVNSDKGYSYFSNYNGVDISAIGREVNSAIPGGGYGPMTGTSMAAAKVTGAAAVILASQSNLTAEALRLRLLNSADKLTHLYNKVTDGRYLNTTNAVSNIAGSIQTVSYEDDFDVYGYAPTPEELYTLFSSLTVVQIEAGNNSHVLMSDGTVWACGGSEPLVQVIGLSNIIAIAAGQNHSLALKSDGTVWAWGSNTSGQLGDGTTTTRTIAVQVSGLTGITTIAAGGIHSLAIKSGGTVWAWGKNSYGQLGDGTTTNRSTAVQVSGLTGITAIAGGNCHSLALKSDGTAWAWGGNGYGQLGDGTTTNRSTAVQVSGLTGITAIAARDSRHSLALKSDGTVWAWGYNGDGQLGDGTTTNRSTAIQASGLTGVTAIAASFAHSLALKSNGTVWAWGNNGDGQLGDGTTTKRSTPVQVSGLTGVVAIAAGSSYSFAIKLDGTVWAWGSNSSGQLCDGIPIIRSTAVQVSSLTGVTAIIGSNHSSALKSDGTVLAWGYNYYGQLGDGTTTNRSTPVQVSNLTGVTAISAGGSHSLALKTNGTVWAWGYNNNGQLGDGTTTQRTTPVQVSGLTGVVAIVTGGSHSLALKSDGTVWAWGQNNNGQLGDGTTTNRSKYVQVLGLSSVTAIAAGNSHSLALKSDGTVWAWGQNSSGQLGDGTTINRTTPVQVSGLTGITAIAGGQNHSLALKSDGTVWACGYNYNGQLGDGTTTQRNTPVQVGGLTGVTEIAAGNSHSLALKSDGTAWAWGYNNYGQLGDGTTINRSAAVQVSGLTGVMVIAAGDHHNLAIKLDGTVWAWGDDTYGQLGLGRILQSSIPIQSFVGQSPLSSDSINFNQSSYSITIPESGSPAATVTVGAIVLDPYGTPIPNANITYSLDSSYTGVNINSTTGVVTVDDTASFGSVGLTASYNGLTAQATLYLAAYAEGEELILGVIDGNLYTVNAWVYDIDDFDGLVFVLTYDPLVLEVDDLSALTWRKELTAGEIEGTGISIISFTPGEIVFSVDEEIPSGMAWTGITNAFRFKAIDTDLTTITISQELSTSSKSTASTLGGTTRTSSATALSAVQSSPEELRALDDAKARELILRLSEYESFTDEEKLFIQNYLGILSDAIDSTAEKPLNALRQLPEDKKALELMRRMNEYESFTDEEKLYIQNYLGLTYELTSEELDYLAELEAQLVKEDSAEAIFSNLLKGTISIDGLNSDDWAKVENYFDNLTELQVRSLAAKGTSVQDILKINGVMRTDMFSLSEAEQLLQLYPDNTARNQLVFDFYLCAGDSDAKTQQNAKTMLLQGANLDTVQKSLNLDANSNIRGVLVDPSLVNGSSSSSSISSSPSGGIPYDINYDPIAPFSIKNGSGEYVDLNSGNLSYLHDILNVSGINGFDLNLSLMYNSSNSVLYVEDYYYNEWAILWYVPYYVDCYSDGKYIRTYDGQYYCFSYSAAQAFINLGEQQWDYKEYWIHEGQGPYSKKWDNVQILAEDPWNQGYPYVISEDPAPSWWWVDDINGNVRYTGSLQNLSGPNLIYYYWEAWDASWGPDWPIYYSRITQIWQSGYWGYIDYFTRSIYEERCFPGNSIVEAYWDYEAYNTTTNKPETNGLGAGWEWNLPSISNNILHLGNGQSYTIGAYNSSTKIYSIKNHTLLDFVLKQDNTYNNGQYTSYLSVTYANGDKAYFNSAGLLLAQKDRYGNTIVYKYTTFNGYSVLSQIVDTAGRTVSLAYATTQTGHTITITAPDNTQTIITMAKITNHGAHTALKSIIDAKGNQTTFNYVAGAGAFNLFTDYDAGYAYNYWALLTEVIYPTQAKKVFGYTKYTDYFGSDGYRQFYRLSSRKDVIGNNNYNVKTYGYTGSSNGEGAYDPDSLPSNYTYSAIVTDNNINGSTIVTTYVFDYKHLLVSETTKYNNAPVALTTYFYNADKLPITVTSRVYNSSGSYMEAILLYEYDNKGNVTAFWNEQANGNKLNTDFKTAFIYDNNYNLLLSKEYKQNSTTTITEVYTLTLDNKSISAVEIKANNVLQAKKEFTYSQYGEVISEKAYKDGFINFVETTYSYDIYGNLTSVINTGIKDADGNLVAGTPGSGSAAGRLAVVFAYDIMGRIIISADATGNVTSYQYDVLGRVTKVVNSANTPDSTFTTTAYDDVNNILTITDELGNQLKYYYDGFGNLLRIYDVTKSQNLQTNTYDAKMRLVTTNNHNDSNQSVLVTYTYDYFDRVLTAVTKDKNNVIIASETYSYDDAFQSGQYSKVTHTTVGDVDAPSIVVSTYTNKSGLLEKQSRTLNNTEYFDYFTYDYVGNLLTEKTAIAVENFNQVPYTSKYIYDFAGRVTYQYNVAGNFAAFSYDALGRLISSTDYAGNITTYSYDDLGRLLTQSTPFETTGGITYYSVTKYFYDGNGNVIEQQTSNNQPGQAASVSTTMYQYNSRNWLTIATQFDGVIAYYTTYTYYANGLLESMTSGNGRSTTTYFYDYAGRLIEQIDALGQSEYFVYDTNGNLIQKTDRNGWVTTYTYDGLGRVLTLSVNTGDPATDCAQAYTYTLTGALLSEDNSEFAAAYTYDELGRLISATEPDSTTKTYTYDIAGNRISYTLKVSNVTQLSTTYTYDYFNRLETVSENGVLVATYTYDINGNRASLVYANGTSEHYTYNLANMVTSVVNKSGNIVISSYSYTYYLDGNQRTKTDHSGEVTTYTYDGIGRLISEVLTVSNVVTESYSYTYDFAHNRLSMLVENSSGAIVTSYLYDLNNRLIKETKGSSVITRYSYDDNGNQILKYYQTLQSSSNTPSSLALTTHGLDTFTYNGLNQLIAVNIGDVEAEYAYKSNGLRIAKTVDGITTKAIWDGSNISLELDDNSSVIAKYIRGLNLLASETSSGRIYYLYNAHGDISQLTDVLGAIVASYSYDAFGNEKSPDPNDLNPFRYCSEYYDTETGNYYLRARYMAPVIGRFISEDTHWNTRNMVYGDNSEGKPSDVIQQQIAYILKKQAIVAKVASDIYTYACWSSDLKILNATRWNLGQLTENEQQALEQVINKIRYVSLEAIIQSGNLYVYCANSPVIFNDATGLWFTRAIISVASGVIFGAIGYNIGKAMSLTGSELTFFTTAFVALGVTIGLVFGVQILTTINNLIKPLLYFFSNPGQLYFGLKILNFVQFEVHAPHHDKPIHFVVRLFVNGGQIAWEWWFGK